MKIVLAFDKFRGSLTASEAVAVATKALARSQPEADCIPCPIADGGEGTVDAIATSRPGKLKWYSVPGPLGAATRAPVFFDDNGSAVIELASASGLEILGTSPALDPGRADTAGTGVLMKKALAADVSELVIGLGGSATNDGGMGIAREFGVRFLDKSGGEITRPADLIHLSELKLRAGPIIKTGLRIRALADVRNVLLGPEGATVVFGPQKGVTGKWKPVLEQGLARLAEISARDLGTDAADLPGSGAAGGVGFGLMTFFHATLEPGFDWVARTTGLAEKIKGADLVITGEGRLDAQTLHGKGPFGVARIASAAGVPVHAIAGSVEERARKDLEKQFDRIQSLQKPDMSGKESQKRAAELMEQALMSLDL